jgi:hypothetical protein
VARSHTPRPASVYLPPRPNSPADIFPALRLGSSGGHQDHRVPRAPLPGMGVTHQPRVTQRSPRRELLLRHRSYGLMRQTTVLPTPRWSLGGGVCAGCRESLLDHGPSRHYLCHLCGGAWTHTPPCSLRCLYPFLPQRQRPHVTGNTFGTRENPCKATSTGSAFSGLQSFADVQAPPLARPPDRSHRSP